MPGDPVRKIGVVGCGYWGPNLVRNLASIEGLDVVCVDHDESRARAVARRHGRVGVVPDVKALFTDPDVTAVMIATPLASHAPLATLALTADKHVFVEKPLAGSATEARALLSLARERDRRLMVGHTFLYSPPVRRIKRLIDAGELGEIVSVSSTRVNLGLHRKDVSVVWDLAAHDFSMFFYWLGQPPVEVSAVAKDFVQPGIPDTAFINLVFPTGTIGHVHVSWLSPSKLRQTTIVGSEKMVVYDDMAHLEQVRVFDRGVCLREPNTFGEFQLSYRTGDVVSPALSSEEPLAVEVAAFLESIRRGVDPPTDGANGLAVVEALEAVDASLRAGAPVLG